MADKVVIEAEVKSNIGEVSDDAADAAGNLALMGVSLNSVKSGFISVARQAKVMFGSIKAGIISTGVGAFIVAIGSLVAYFTQTEKGAEKLRVIMSGIGATTNVLIERFAKVGKTLTNVFNQNILTTIRDIRDAFKGVGKEIKEDVTATTELTKRTNELQDAERKLRVETANTRAEIEKNKLIAEDTTKSEEERITAAKTAFKDEKELLAERIRLAQEDVDIQTELNRLKGEAVKEEDLDALAEKEIALANIKQESLTKQIELNNKVNQIEADAQRKREEFEEKQIQQAEDFQARIDAHLAARVTLNNAIAASFGQLSKLFKEGSAASKAFALAEIATTTAVGYLQALDIAQKSSLASGPAAALAFPIFYASQIAAVLGAVSQASQILGSAPSVSSVTPGTGGNAVAPQMVGGAFELGGGVAPEPLRAYVLTDEMSNSQNQLANIRRRATI